MRWVNMVAFVAVCAMAVTLFVYKNETRQLESHVANLQRRIQQERETIAVLKTEWSHLTRPERLERLASKYLDMAPVRTSQIVTPNQIMSAITPAIPSANIANVIDHGADLLQIIN